MGYVIHWSHIPFAFIHSDSFPLTCAVLVHLSDYIFGGWISFNEHLHGLVWIPVWRGTSGILNSVVFDQFPPEAASHARVFRGARFSSLDPHKWLLNRKQHSFPIVLFAWYFTTVNWSLKWPINSCEIKCWQAKHD